MRERYRDPIALICEGLLKLALILVGLSWSGCALWRAAHRPPPLSSPPSVLLTCLDGVLFLETSEGWSPLTALPQDRAIPTTIVLLVQAGVGEPVACAWQATQVLTSPDRRGPGRR